jgi:PAS domain S-box-containing protein
MKFHSWEGSRRLATRITIPLIFTILVMGIGLYSFNLRLLSDFADRRIRESLSGVSHDIYKICDSHFSKILEGGLLSNGKAVRISKARTIGDIEDFMRKYDIGCRIVDNDGSELFSFELPSKFPMRVAPQPDARATLVVDTAGRGYYVAWLTFEPWSWKIAIYKSASEFSKLINDVRIAYFITGFMLMLSGAILLHTLNRNVKSPLQSIIDDIRSGKKPKYKGVAEFEDLSENVGQMMDAVRESEGITRGIAAGLGEGVYVVDRGGCLVFMNPEAERLLGWKEAELLGVFVHDVIHRHKTDNTPLPWSECPILTTMETGITRRTEDELFGCKDGSILPVSCVTTPLTKDGRISGAVTAFQDMTERLQAAQEHKRLVTAVEQAAEAIYITDRQFIINYVNPAFERLSGRVRNEIIGEHARILKSEKHNSEFYRRIRDTLVRGEVWSGILTITRKDGSSYEAEMTASPVLDRRGAIINYVNIHRDITNEQRLERQLRQAQKMEAIGTLAGGIAHDFNNILTSILGYTEIAYERVRDDSVRRNLEQVLKAGARATDLVRQILTFSRQSEYERKPIQVAVIIKEALKLLRSSLPSTIEIRENIQADAENSVILADSTQIHQVLMNLCTNAAHAMRAQGGVLSVMLAEVEVDRVLVSANAELRTGPYVRVSVSDTGHGIEVGVLERIFDPYFTTKGLGEGTGLGLSLVQGIVRSHGGAVTVYSEPGKGATFNVFIPRIVQNVVKRNERAVNALSGHERILFVDDESALTGLGKQMLESLGYAVTAIESSLAALDAFRARPDAFDLVITDMTMPGLTGSELAKALMAIRPDIPVILCTGFSGLMNEQMAKQAGICEFIMKPYSLSILAGTVRRALDHGT